MTVTKTEGGFGTISAHAWLRPNNFFFNQIKVEFYKKIQENRPVDLCDFHRPKARVK